MPSKPDTRILRLHGGPLDGKIVMFRGAAIVTELRVPFEPAEYYGPDDELHVSGFGAYTYDLSAAADATELSVEDLVSLQEPVEPLDEDGLRPRDDDPEGDEWKK